MAEQILQSNSNYARRQNGLQTSCAKGDGTSDYCRLVCRLYGGINNDITQVSRLLATAEATAWRAGTMTTRGKS